MRKNRPLKKHNTTLEKDRCQASDSYTIKNGAYILLYSYVQLQLCNHIFMELQGETELFLEKISKYHKDKVKNATCDLNAYLCTQDLIPFYNANIKERST